MFDVESLRKLSRPERRRLMRDLVELERDAEPALGTSWKWDAALVAIVACCVALAAWIGILAVTLPPHYRAGGWRGTWVGFDVAELLAFAASGWAAWRRRQLLIVSLVVLATLLVCDAWFDVMLDDHTAGFPTSLASALLVELPLALLAILFARRLLRLAIGRMMQYEGLTGPVPPLWQIPLLGPGTGTPLRRLIAARARKRSASDCETKSVVNGASRASTSGTSTASGTSATTTSLTGASAIGTADTTSGTSTDSTTTTTPEMRGEHRGEPGAHDGKPESLGTQDSGGERAGQRGRDVGIGEAESGVE